jgi:hypothetical protein
VAQPRAIAPISSAIALAATLAVLGVAVRGLPAQDPPPAASVEARGVAYLSREVPRWRQEHACYSCHNNGDAARALIAALGRQHDVRRSLDDTLAWLAQPERWNSNPGGEGGGDDKRLARIQFAFATATAAGASQVPHDALTRAAAIIAADQSADGSWRLDSSDSVGSPATYGTALATSVARLTLVRSRQGSLKPAIGRADAWLQKIDPHNIPDAAAVVLAFHDSREEQTVARLRKAIEFLERSQAPDGGWGPYANSPREPFDTALAVIALHRAAASEASIATASTRDAWRDAISRGRSFLSKSQLGDGSWPETTRPANQGSYAQRISTSAWALLAMLETGSY